MSTVAKPLTPGLAAPSSAANRSADVLTRAPVLEIQRARLLAATNQLLGERGAGGVSVALIVDRAGVSRRTFYELFSDCESCVLAALHAALERAREQVLPAWRTDGSWRERLRASLIELLRLFDHEQALARLLVVESLSLGRPVLELRARVLAGLVSALDEGRAGARTGSEPPPLSAEGAAGGALGVLYSRLTQPGGSGSLLELTNPLMSMLVLPYRGAAAARAELDHPTPAAHARAGEAGEPCRLHDDPFKAAGVRMTYRTMRVLEAIGEQGERGISPSNRQVAVLAEIGDQGQVSKLLTRLDRAGLIDNGGRERAKGEPNAWRLTALGEQVVQTICGHRDGHHESRAG